MEINNFQGGLTVISAEPEPLVDNQACGSRVTSKLQTSVVLKTAYDFRTICFYVQVPEYQLNPVSEGVKTALWGTADTDAHRYLTIC